ncbi:MAG: hypothetical protein HFJ58_00100 [Clostridia bacterium]|nr:hypothetical protein [Clostridia bacterium]
MLLILELFGITSLMALAYNINFNGYICSLIDAKNDNVYFGLFDNSTNNHMKENDYLAENINYITEILKKCNKPIFFVGNGSILYKDMLQSTLKEKAIFPDANTYNNLTAVSIGMAAFDVYTNNTYNDLEYNLSPVYLKKSSAERELEEKQNGNSNK